MQIRGAHAGQIWRRLFERGGLAVAAVALLLGVPQLATAAGSASLSLSPYSGSYAPGSTITFTVSENSGTVGVNAAEADLTYDQTKLQFVSIGTRTSAFDVSAAAKGGSGRVTISRAKLAAPLTGDQALATVTFKVAAGATGTATVTLASTSAILDAQTNQNIWDNQSLGAKFTLTGSGSSSSQKHNSAYAALILVVVIIGAIFLVARMISARRIS